MPLLADPPTRARFGRSITPLLSDRSELLGDLAKIGPPLSTTVVVNGRPVMLDAALRLVDQLPETSVVALRYRYLSIRPDPLAAQRPYRPTDDLHNVPAPAEVVRGLLESHRERERANRRHANVALAVLLAFGPIISLGLLLLARAAP